ncbi:MAG: RsbRD N-terminal domain-containing protein [Acidobacteria bacterium]|jgi:hypothetical protein|nr:RsbRD N-terminal domain-containing protein [Acidobacteriota bacterium]
MLDGGLIAARRSALLSLWWDSAVEAFPGETRSFLAREKDRFQNPVGATLRSGLMAILDALLTDADDAELERAAQAIVKVRAVQGVPAGEALAFVFGLKKAARAALGEQAETAGGRRELEALENAVDRLALLAFTSYVGCRERIFAIRSRELQRRTASLLRQTAGVDLSDPGADDLPDSDPDCAFEGGSTA